LELVRVSKVGGLLRSLDVVDLSGMGGIPSLWTAIEFL
jgi:hypothetical protein